MSSISKTILIIAITSVIFFACGFAAGSITANIRLSRFYRLDDIRVQLDNLAGFNSHPIEYKRVKIQLAKTNLVTLMCSMYRNLNNKEKKQARDYIIKYNSVASSIDGGISLPVVKDGLLEGQVRQEFCKLS